MPSKMFYLNPTVADTLTAAVPTTGYLMPPGDWVVNKIRVAYGNVVNATGNQGFIHIETVERSYDFAYGGGQGGATNSGNGHAEEIKCAIHAPGNTLVYVYILDATAHIGEYISLNFEKGGQNPYRTMAAGGVSGSGDTAALTEENITTSSKLLRANLTPAVEGHIRQIRFSACNVVDAKTSVGYIKVIVPNEAGPFEFAINSGAGGAAANGNPADADVIDCDIPVHANSTIEVKITTLEAAKYPHVSLHYW